VRKRILFTLIAALSWQSCLYAEPALKQNDGAQQALKKAQGVLRKLTEEKAALEQEKVDLLKEKDVLQTRLGQLENTVKQLTPLQNEVVAQKNAAEALRSTNGSLSSQLSDTRENVRQLKAQQQEIITQAKAIQNDNQLLVSAVKERERWISQCSEKNQKVIAAADELAKKYDSKSLWQQLSEAEPFTGIGSVEVQNINQNYQFSLDTLKVTPFDR
jgi:chromosome segregation ATPase